MSIKLPEAKNRPVIRTLLLMLLLAGTVGVAYGLVNWKNRYINEGRDILQTIREKGLDKYWGDTEESDYYLIAYQGHVLGFKILQRQSV